MSAPWSKLKSRVEALWVPGLPLAIHCTAYANSAARRGESRLSRHWLMLGKERIWDFPGPFLTADRKRRGPVPHADEGWPNGGEWVAHLLRDYLDRPVPQLFEPFEADAWELTDVLRAADRRLGRSALIGWASRLDEDHPAWKVLNARFGSP